MNMHFDNKLFAWDTLKRALIFYVFDFLIIVLCVVMEALFLYWAGDPFPSGWQLCRSAMPQTNFLFFAISLVYLIPNCFNQYSISGNYLMVKEYYLFGEVFSFCVDLSTIDMVKSNRKWCWNRLYDGEVLLQIDDTKLRLHAFTNKDALIDEINKRKKEF